MVRVERSAPCAAAADAISMEDCPAMKTPMKLTRSFPAKESARAMVPARTDIFRMLILQMFWRTAIRTVQNTRLQHTYSQM